ncbi:efflux RND transporter periplasmic adaptor subunit [Undibacterium sp. LX40W]|uniref:Efflux RND transporter periplasmic adaptor subunit n=1 Tax=Undibacterium nitidum TaxID=2762298 RepID=A0A923KTD9_9BURK|nr:MULTISPECIES: efflux RND transporter periplasmic adaptor subunit [Undibacterium]MBC3881474.1 efflux RND transporter periplasmic adaptor subunit [Undibacterium nitidum]MBC3891744.1 efflux RND transporter periplasmic adaptor subunit [Undibacterium sp. LX40W]
MLRPSLLILALSLSLTACQKGGKESKTASASASAQATLQVTQEDYFVVENNALASGPVITGSIQPERKADLRAEVSAIVMQVLKENGEAVRKGDLLARLDDTSFRDQLGSSEQAARAAQQTLDQAERQLERLKTLRASGMTSMQALEDAEIRRNNAQSELVAAKARNVAARQQLQRTEIRAPFDGIVSERKVSNGDTAQIGKEIMKVIDPSSLRFQGLVSAESVSVLKAGQSVSFRINGYDQQFIGKVRRVDPAANATTRQVEVLVDFVGSNQPRVSGLYAEGRIEAGSTQALTVLSSALIRDGDKTFVWAIQDGLLKRAAIIVGERDVRRGDYAVASGLKIGDKVLRQPMSTFKEGSKVVLTASAGAAAPTAAPVVPAAAPASTAVTGK